MNTCIPHASTVRAHHRYGDGFDCLFGGFRLAVTAAIWVAWMALAPGANAATNIVLATDNLQQKIDAAAQGDILVLQGGAYSGAITVNKPLSFVRSGTNNVQLLATVTVQTTGAVAFVQMDFSASVAASGGVDLLLQNSSLNSSLSINGGRLTVRRSNIDGNISLTSADFNAVRMTNAAVISATATVGTGKKFVLTQSKASGISVAGYQAWLAHNTLGSRYPFPSSIHLRINRATFCLG